MRRVLAWSVLLLAWLVAVATAGRGAQGAQSASAQARIKIDVDRTIGEVHPHLFGNFAEHLGRMIYGGIYEEGSPLSDADSYRRDVMDAVRRLGVSILRWPGGNFASGYNWKDGIGPKDRRPVRAELAWNALESNRFGTDEFLRYAERIGAFGDDRKVRPVTRSAQVSIDNNGFTYTFPAHSLTILRVGVQ